MFSVSRDSDDTQEIVFGIIVAALIVGMLIRDAIIQGAQTIADAAFKGLLVIGILVFVAIIIGALILAAERARA